MKKLILACALLGQTLQAQTTYSIYDTLQVNHNELHFDMRDFKGSVLQGKAIVSIESKRDELFFAPLLLQQMQVDTVWVNGRRVDHYQYNDTLLRIPLKPALRKGEEARLTIAYHGKPQGSSFGGLLFNDSLQMAYNMGASINDIPHSYGRGWFPATDDFRSRTTFDLYFRVDSDKKAIGSGVLVDTVPAAAGSTVWHWTVRQPIPDYLVNVAVGDYRKIHFEHTQEGHTLPIDIYVLPEEVEAATETYSIIPDVLKVLERRFGAYSFDRVGYVSVDSPGGAMEHVGNISMPMNPQPTQRYRELAIHELIHGWFGNKVTCATAGDMWLNEGITSYCPEVVLEEIGTPEDVLRYRQSYLLTGLLFSSMYDQGYWTLAGMPEVHTYGPTVYMKGASVVRALRKMLGDDRFFPAMKAYVEQFAFHHVTTKEFETFMSQHTGVDLTDFFNLYIYQPGFVAFEIESLSARPVDDGYRVALQLEQKLCHAPAYAEHFRLPVSFYGKGGRSEKRYVTVGGARTDCTVDLPFEPVGAVVDTEQEICKASLYEPLRLDTAGTYHSFCQVELSCKRQPSVPVMLHMEYYHVAPDPQKSVSAYRLSDTHYWRMTGELSQDNAIGAHFLVNKQMKDSALLTDGVNELTLMYRNGPSDDWQPLQTVPVDVKERRMYVALEQVKCGEYCLAVRK